MYSPKFIITPQLNNQIAQIEKFKQVVETSRIIPEQEISLRYRSMLESVHSSTSIEGNPLSPQQVQDVIIGRKIRAIDQAVIEVENYKKALDWFEQRVETKKKLSAQDAFKLHSMVVDRLLPAKKIGQIRPGQIYIIDEIGDQDIIQYTGPNPSKVKSLLDNLFFWIKNKGKELHPVLLAGILHYEFVSIHPFSDGNGRVTRLLTKLLLSLNHYDFKGVLVLDNYYAQDRLAYYQALSLGRTYSQRNKADLTPWLEYFVGGVVIEAEALAEEFSVISLKEGEVRVKLSKEEISILSFVKHFGQISLAEARDMVKGTDRTVQRRLKKLVVDGFLEQQDQARRAYYKLKS
ncbi:Fic family protein [Patescibacteria group bacterium]|nr:Fic family protein [Patescibacteria group bacterium]MBU1885328.1 Fic family protein [Patescibacteria group bacterium]